MTSVSAGHIIYTDTDSTSRERAATAGIEPGTSSPILNVDDVICERSLTLKNVGITLLKSQFIIVDLSVSRCNTRGIEPVMVTS